MVRQPWTEKPGLPVQEAARLLGCEQETITGMIRGGLSKARKPAPRRRWLIPAAEVDRLKER